MIIYPPVQVGRVPNFPYDESISSLLDKIQELIYKFEKSLINREETISNAQKFIQQLSNLAKIDIVLARKGLCDLLKLEIEELQRVTIGHLRPLFEIKYLAYDIENKQSQQLVTLEKQLSGILSSHLSSSLDFLLPVIDLYQDVLERLWLLPYLTDDRSSYATIIDEHGHQLMDNSAIWLKFSERKSNKPKTGNSIS